MQNDINISSEKDPILIKIEAQNSLLKNFFMNKNNFKSKENKENISNNINNDNYKLFINKYNNKTSEKIMGKNMKMKILLILIIKKFVYKNSILILNYQ